MLNFEEQYIPDEKERLKFLLEQYLPFLLRHATPTTIKNHEFISLLLNEKKPHEELLKNIQSIFATNDGKPMPLNLSEDIEKKLGPNRFAEYLGLHADLSYLVTQNMNQ